MSGYLLFLLIVGVIIILGAVLYWAYQESLCVFKDENEQEGEEDWLMHFWHNTATKTDGQLPEYHIDTESSDKD